MLQVNQLIQDQLGEDMVLLERFTQKAQATFTSIQEGFIDNDVALVEEIAVGALTLAARYNPFWSLASGAISGYKIAGVKGAAVGGVTGAVCGAAGGFGTLMAGVYGVGYFVALTNPVALTIVAATTVVSGLSAWYGGRMATAMIFGDDIVHEFKTESSRAIIEAFEGSLPQVVHDLQSQTNELVQTLYQNLTTEVQRNFGDTINQTESLLSELTEQRLSTGVDREAQKRRAEGLHADLGELHQSTTNILNQIQDIKTQMEMSQ